MRFYIRYDKPKMEITWLDSGQFIISSFGKPPVVLANGEQMLMALQLADDMANGRPLSLPAS